VYREENSEEASKMVVARMEDGCGFLEKLLARNHQDESGLSGFVLHVVIQT